MNIKQTLQSILGVPKTPKTVDQILSTFATTVAELKATREHQLAQSASLAAQAAMLNAQSEAADKEAARAHAAATKIEQFLA